MATVQVVAVPEHAPPQPPKVLPASGVAVKVTLAPLAKVVVAQTAPQLMPDGVLTTEPEPDLVTLSV